MPGSEQPCSDRNNLFPIDRPKKSPNPRPRRPRQTPTEVQLSIMAAIHIPERPFLPPSPPDTHKRSLDDLPDAPDPTRKRRRTHAALPTPEDSTAAGTPTEDVPRDATGRPRIYACTFAGCTARFSRPCRREEHERRHTGARPFVCGLPAIPQPGD
jgi:hypothetical protein